MSPRDFFLLLRPWQWTKNGILFAGLVFSEHLFDPAYFLRAAAATAFFCLASSAVYVFNDIFDLERDRIHPAKQSRPLASGRVTPGAGIGLFVVLAAVTLGAASRLGPDFLITLGVFFLLNVLYSIRLKNLVILDVMLIALSFVLRAIAGVTSLRPLDATIEISPWLLVCTLFLALFLGLAKRRHELESLDAAAVDHRITLGAYTRALLDQLIAVVTAATLIAYAIYTIAPATLSKFHSPDLVATIPFVAYGIFRYLYLIQRRDDGGDPSRTLYRDPGILVTTVGWLVAVVIVIYVGRS